MFADAPAAPLDSDAAGHRCEICGAPAEDARLCAGVSDHLSFPAREQDVSAARGGCNRPRHNRLQPVDCQCSRGVRPGRVSHRPSLLRRRLRSGDGGSANSCQAGGRIRSGALRPNRLRRHGAVAARDAEGGEAGKARDAGRRGRAPHLDSQAAHGQSPLRPPWSSSWPRSVFRWASSGSVTRRQRRSFVKSSRRRSPQR